MARLNRVTGETNSITDVTGIHVGNYSDRQILSGTTVIIPEERAKAGVDIRGGAPGTREVALLDPVNLVQEVDAVTLSGGSSYGLATATGVMEYLEEQGRGYKTRKGETVPIVPAAILYDLYRGEKRGKLTGRAGYMACLDAGKRFQMGNHGAGTGAVSGSLKGGLGSASEAVENDYMVGALAAVNSAGHTCDPVHGGFYARYLEIGDEYKGINHLPIDASVRSPLESGAGESTLLGVVATDVELSKTELTKVAQMAHDGVARAIHPAHTMYDGDTVFALSTGAFKASGPRGSLVSIIGSTAADVLSRSIIHGVLAAETVNGITCYRDKFGET